MVEQTPKFTQMNKKKAVLRKKNLDGKSVESNKLLAALCQIQAAIVLFKKGEYECAVTLAAAAEGLLPPTNDPHLFQVLKDSPEAKKIDFNRLINWLKHPTGPEIEIFAEFEVAIIIVRAISKFLVTYKTVSPAMKDFIKWTFEKGHLPDPRIAEQ